MDALRITSDQIQALLRSHGSLGPGVLYVYGKAWAGEGNQPTGVVLLGLGTLGECLVLEFSCGIKVRLWGAQGVSYTPQRGLSIARSDRVRAERLLENSDPLLPLYLDYLDQRPHGEVIEVRRKVFLEDDQVEIHPLDSGCALELRPLLPEASQSADYEEVLRNLQDWGKGPEPCSLYCYGESVNPLPADSLHLRKAHLSSLSASTLLIDFGASAFVSLKGIQGVQVEPSLIRVQSAEWQGMFFSPQSGRSREASLPKYWRCYRRDSERVWGSVTVNQEGYYAWESTHAHLFPAFEIRRSLFSVEERRVRKFADQIRSLLPHLFAGAPCFYGGWFISPVHEPRRVVDVACEGECLILRFSHHEILRVWNPKGMSASAYRFEIEEASRVQWCWYDYRLPRSAETLCYLDYRKAADRLVTDTNADHRVIQGGANPRNSAIRIL